MIPSFLKILDEIVEILITIHISSPISDCFHLPHIKSVYGLKVSVAIQLFGGLT